MGLKSVGTVKETATVEMYDPATSETLLNNDGTPMTITFHGPYSKKYKTASNAQQNRRLMKAQRTGGKMNLTAEELEASNMDLLVKCIEDWNITLDTEKEPFSEAKVREVFAELPWVKEQVDAAFGNTAAFLAK